MSDCAIVQYNKPEELPCFLHKYTTKILHNYWLEHPLYRIMLPFDAHEDISREIRRLKNDLRSALTRSEWDDALSLIEPDRYCSRFLLRIVEPKIEKSNYGDKIFWSLVFECLRNKASTSRQQPYLNKLLNINRSFRERTLCGEDFAHFENLTFPIVAWRGVAADSENSAKAMMSKGLSWSLSRDIATKFAKFSHYNSGQPFLAKATLARENVLAYLPSHSEEEIIINPTSDWYWIFVETEPNCHNI